MCNASWSQACRKDGRRLSCCQSRRACERHEKIRPVILLSIRCIVFAKVVGSIEAALDLSQPRDQVSFQRESYIRTATQVVEKSRRIWPSLTSSSDPECELRHLFVTQFTVHFFSFSDICSMIFLLQNMINIFFAAFWGVDSVLGNAQYGENCEVSKAAEAQKRGGLIRAFSPTPAVVSATFFGASEEVTPLTE